jgi:ferredoxin-type protein NapF
MASNTQRRAFFRRITGAPVAQRPPWALPEPEFANACDGCGDCIRACPQAILVPAAWSLPRVDFARGACTFCQRCADACDRQAFSDPPSTPAWTLRAQISTACLEPQGIACRVCETACDERALRFRPMTGGRAQVIVSPESCTGCGACLATCPAGAISVVAPNDREAAA